MKRAGAMTVFGGIILLSVLTACGHSYTKAKVTPHHHETKPRQVPDVSTPPSYSPKSTSVPVESSTPAPIIVSAPNPPLTFPAIIQMAMAHVPGPVSNVAMAPTLIPWPNNGSKVLYYLPQSMSSSAQEPLLVQSFRVTLTAPPSPVGSFMTALFKDSADAQGTITRYLLQTGLAYPADGKPLNIGSQIVAKTASSRSIDVMGWHEGQWTVVVAEADSMPVSVATQVAQYLHGNYLPAPLPAGSGVGLLVVNITAGGIHTHVAWQSNNVEYSVDTYPQTANPVSTALNLVLSMKKYPA